MLSSTAARKLANSRKPEQRKGGRPVKLTRCPRCHQMFTARNWRYHPPRCLG